MIVKYGDARIGKVLESSDEDEAKKEFDKLAEENKEQKKTSEKK